MDYAEGLALLARGGPRGGRRLPRPRHLLDAGGRPRARLLLLLRRAAGHAHGSRPGARRAHGRQRVGRAPARPDLPPLRRGAQRAQDRARDRRAGGAARRSRRPASWWRRSRPPCPPPCRRSFGGGPPGQAGLPGDPDRGQRRARLARPRAAAGLGPAAPRRPLRRDLVPLARGPARQALPGRARPRLHLPAGLPGLRLRARARGRAADRPRRSRRPRARWRTTRARSPAGCARPAGSRPGRAPDGPRRRRRSSRAPARSAPGSRRPPRRARDGRARAAADQARLGARSPAPGADGAAPDGPRRAPGARIARAARVTRRSARACSTPCSRAAPGSPWSASCSPASSSSTSTCCR